MTALAAPAPPRRRRRSTEGRDAWLLVLPALLPVMLFSVYPLVYGVLLGFTDAEAGLNVETHFNGLDNYTALAGNELFWNSFKIGLIWAFSVTILQFLASLGLALLLNLNLRLRWLARTLALIPWAMPPVIIAIMWQLMLNPNYGPVNRTLESLGLPSSINWLGESAIALPVVIVVGVWAGMPQTTITLLAGLQSVPAELNEAAAIDGATTWRRFWHVTLPALRPIITAITTLDLIWNFNSFALVFVLTAGGPGGTTMLPSLFAYNEAFRYGNFGYAAAMGNVMVILIGAFLFLYLRAQMRSRTS
ncbi:MULTISPECIES: carbohydrate ABC transporter permease [Glycomyces]|uniref:Multiple sugar transport system permease protein n=1 Tax=Glycomyces artemisiae TaxID=1076443 RepID=A0A2T0UFL8_9ACTN|nr:sugar ABC transporter permease [Glycomyces artemisiae]NUQ90833.1 sugar ABC transporter permease [Glycomyces artemisiae]PRY56745.1 multiple sugar transport system permease protein [Glycomyces artemisiae]